MNKISPAHEAETGAVPVEEPDERGRDGSNERQGREGRDEADGGKSPPHDIIDLRKSDADGDKEGEGKPSDDPKARKEGGGNPEQDSKPDADTEQSEGKEADEPPPEAPPKIVFIAVGLVLLACLAWGAWSHWRSYSEAKQTTSETVNRPVEVRTQAAYREDSAMSLTLPGETDAFDTANIYARATGYISERRVDIGSRVKQGDLLVHIAAPDLDHQLAQAIAQKGQTEAAIAQAQTQVTQAEANVNLAKVNYARTNQLTQQGYESLQNRDTQQANVQTQEANVQSAKAGIRVAEANDRAQQATIDRLQALAAFEDVRAPFDGVITSRNVDTGDLINADASTGSPMFTISRDSTIRVTVRVPQNSAIGILNGLGATVHVPQMPDRPFKGRVQRTSGALLYSSRSLTAEVDVPNPDGLLRSGLYVTVDFEIPREHPNVTVPAEALIFNQQGLQVATVEDGKAKMHGVNIYRDHGTTIELRDGLDGGEHVVLSPPATLADGAQVKETREEDQKKDKDKKPDGDKGGKDAGSEKQAKSDDSQK